MIAVKHLDKSGKQQFNPERLNSIFIFAIKKLDEALEYKQEMSGSNHKFKWSFEKTNDGFNITIQDL
jgi:hypothetical protein